MGSPLLTPADIKRLVAGGCPLPLATKNYPSRGQSAVQELYQTPEGKLFLKKVSPRNHKECQIDPKQGSLAEREYWAFCLARFLGLRVPELWLIDDHTTVQRWLDLPDARTFKTLCGKAGFKTENIFECALFDWITGQVDRHDANYLCDYVQGEIVLIDSSHCFMGYSGSMPDYLSYHEAGGGRELQKHFKVPVSERTADLVGGGMSRLVPLRSAEPGPWLDRASSWSTSRTRFSRST